MRYTPKQLEYIKSVDNPHMSALRIIGELKADIFKCLVETEKLKKKAAYWEAKAGEYKALLENMERVG
jgi:Txe/YoeB family toxin of Txe-Axe toxin-antitoxin module